MLIGTFIISAILIAISMVIMDRMQVLDIYVYIVGSLLLITALGFLVIFNYEFFVGFLFLSVVMFGLFVYFRKTRY